MANVKNFVRFPVLILVKRKHPVVKIKSAYGNVYGTRFSSGIKLEGDETLDADTWTVNGNEAKTVKLRDIRDRLDKAYAGMLLSGQTITANAVFRFAFPDTKVGKPRVKKEKPTTLRAALDHLLAQTTQEWRANEITTGNLTKQSNHAETIHAWAVQHFGSVAVTLDTVRPGHLKTFMLWLKTDRHYATNYAAYIAKYFKRVMAHSVANGFIVNNPFATIRIAKEHSRGEYLTPDEVQKLRDVNVTLLGEPLILALDIFLWQCVTGASFSDSVSLTQANIFRAEDGTTYLKYQRGKVKKKGAGWAIVPLLPEAAALIDKYREHPLRIQQGTLLPGRSYDKTNKGLAMVGRLAGIEKKITTHVARRTFATHYLNEGIQLATVSRMLGHADTSVTQRHYAEMRPEGVIREMRPFLTPKNAS